ncbi:MAG TPA: DNA-binding protein [Nitrosomonas sp.]|nr:DNA-binding protein [Nitrosomonas sp.]HNB02147.1 DNA-binding protein [Nitrosomonas sp.]HNG37312.1 DNA-binding protein [Nitrosomonas sp.]HNJ38221.1 DNA-binding protein [Nitrosomonas sp.]HNM01219.1 DNA-binding protein [Nitrosomonas sp.]
MTANNNLLIQINTKMKELKTLKQAREELDKRGISMSKWARQHGLSEAIVRDVLRGDKKGVRGDAHKAAVLLGIKDGVIE